MLLLPRAAAMAEALMLALFAFLVCTCVGCAGPTVVGSTKEGFPIVEVPIPVPFNK